MSYIFQHICRIVISRDHIQLIRRALAEPDVVSSDTDTILGSADLWDGRYIEARLCGRPGQTALLAGVLYDFGGELQTYRNSTECHPANKNSKRKRNKIAGEEEKRVPQKRDGR